MANTFKELTHLVVDARLRPGAPRFNASGLRDVRLKGGNAIFYLDTGNLSVPIEELTLEEGRIAYDYCADVETKENEDKGFLDYLGYRFFPPVYVLKYYLYTAIVILSIFGLLIAIDYIGDSPFLNDKNKAVGIAMGDPYLQQYVGKNDAQVETISCYYYDPATGNIIENRSDYMVVGIRAWYIPYDLRSTMSSSGQLFDAYIYNIKVDLRNNSIISSDHSKVVN